MTERNSKTLKAEDLAQFTGSTQWFQHAFFKAVIYTEGVRYVAREGGAYWLIDEIAGHLVSPQFNQAAKRDPRIEQIHFWKLTVNADDTADLEARVDSGVKPFVKKHYPFTDFPLSEQDIWAAKNELDGYTLMLPSEY